jgi:hypothetical protein
MNDETGRAATERPTCEVCRFGRLALNGVTMMCDADGHDRSRMTYRSHRCLRIEVRDRYANATMGLDA